MNQANTDEPGPLPVSVYLITLNEASNIENLLPELSIFDEVILVDSGSTDRTLEIARQFPNVRIFHRTWSGFGDQKNYARSLCSNEWLLNLDADEAPGRGYLAAMRELIERDDADALRTRRVLYRHGRRPRNFFKDEVMVRFFRKNCGYYAPARVHEKLTIIGKVRDADAELDHFENLTFTERIQKSNHYSQLKARDKFDQGKRSNLLLLLLVFPFSFAGCYVLRGCFLDGYEGVMVSANHAFYNFMKYAKLWELQRKIPAGKGCGDKQRAKSWPAGIR